MAIQSEREYGMYTVEQLERGEGLAANRSMNAFTYDGENWHTCDLGESIGGEPVEVVTVPPVTKGGWSCRA